MMEYKIQIIEGASVDSLTKDKAFVHEWKELSNIDKYITVNQEPEFVLAWYEEYSNRFSPIVVLAVKKDSRIVGIMPLAISKDKKRITHAGDHQAEYHGWICLNEIKMDFPIKVLIAIKNKYKVTTWKWRWLPPNLSDEWINSKKLTKNNIYSKAIKQKSPVLDMLDDKKVEELKKNRSIKSKINRFKKRGEFYLEHVKSKSRALEIFDDLILHCDFRHFAVHKTMPFKEDINKKRFYLRRLDSPESNHFTVLWADKTPIAFHFGVCDNNTVLIGLSGYNPIEERNSPGAVLMIKLIELLKDEGYRYLDLTPGKDQYKKRYANEYQNCYRTDFFFNYRSYIKASVGVFIGNIFRKIISCFGIKPQYILTYIKEEISFFKENPLRTLKNYTTAFRILLPLKVLTLQMVKRQSCIGMAEVVDNGILSFNKYEELFLLEKRFSKNFLSNVFSKTLKRISAGDKLFTYTINGNLHSYGWLISSENCKERWNIHSSLFSKVNVFIEFSFIDKAHLKSNSSCELYRKILDNCVELNSDELVLINKSKKLLKKCQLEGFSYKYEKHFKLFGFPLFFKVSKNEV